MKLLLSFSLAWLLSMGGLGGGGMMTVFTCDHVCDKERKPADDEDPHHCAQRLGGFCLFGEPVINFAQKKIPLASGYWKEKSNITWNKHKSLPLMWFFHPTKMDWGMPQVSLRWKWRINLVQFYSLRVSWKRSSSCLLLIRLRFH